MRTMFQKGLFGILVAAGLAFGSVQVTATPAKAATTVNACTEAGCSGDCIRRGYYLGGRCVEGDCICWEDAK